MSESVNVYFGEECDHLCTYVTESAYDDLSGDYEALRAENEQLHDDYSEVCDDAMAVARKLRAAEVELTALKAVPGGVEVVGAMYKVNGKYLLDNLILRHYYRNQWAAEHDYVQPELLMTVAQHNAIVAEKDHHLQLLGQLLGDCISAAGITRPDAPLSGPELLMFGNDLLTVLTDMRESVADEREASEAILEFEKSGWHGSRGYHAGLLKAAQIVDELAALSAPAAGQDVSTLVEALEKIVAIEHQEYGADWEEIEEAQEIASAALAAHKAGGVE